MTREPYGTRVSYCFSKSARILRSSEFRNVYDSGIRIGGPYFAAFCLRVQREGGGPRLGFTVARAFGGAVQRNRAKRCIREALRVRLPEIAPHWDIVLNPRRQVLQASPEALRREIDRLISKCANL